MTTAGYTSRLYSAHRHLLDPEEVRSFSRLRPLRPIVDSMLSWAWIGAAWTAVALVPEWWVVALAIPVIGSRGYALHVIGHDAIHRRLFRSGKVNDLFCDLILFGPVGAVIRVNGRNHLLHHQLLSTSEDPDRYKYSSQNKSTSAQTWLFLTGLSGIIPAIRHVFLNRPAGTSGPALRDPHYSARDVAIILLWQIVLIGGLSAAIGLWAYPVLWVLPVYLFTYCANLARQFLEHAHAEPDERADPHRLITFASHPLERPFLSPLNMNFHTVHHLWPSIPYYNLPAADRLVRARNPSETLHWKGSYASGLAEYFRRINAKAPLHDAPPR